MPIHEDDGMLLAVEQMMMIDPFLIRTYATSMHTSLESQSKLPHPAETSSRKLKRTSNRKTDCHRSADCDMYCPSDHRGQWGRTAADKDIGSRSSNAIRLRVQQ